jgi:phage shock protein E
MMKFLIAGAVVVVVMVMVLSARAAGDSATAKKKIAGGALIIDVRTANEYAAGHLDGATNIPYDAIGGRIAAVTTNKAQEIVVYCRSGGRAGAAQKTLQGLGYTNVVNGGGYEALKKP